jgi:hypothetical protein
MAHDPKNTIYIDVDDEITGVIDKVLDSSGKLVALVLPKRASVFQSIVNMKLLKRKADEAGKNIVLVTTEESLLPLAGAVGLHVAKNLASKPEIPAPPIIQKEMVESVEEETTPKLDEETGEGSVDLKDLALNEIEKVSKKPELEDEDTIELDNTDENSVADTAMPAAAVASAEAKKKAKKDKKLKIPNFERFRLYALLVGSLLLIIIVFWVLMFKVWPHATIDIKTNSQNVNANLTFNLSTTATSLDKSTNTVPAKQVSESKTYTATVNATGQQNNGQTASGSVTMIATVCPADSSSDANYPLPENIPAGTGIVQSSLTYITQSNTSFSSHGKPGNGGCIIYNQIGSTNISAQQPGSKYNASGNNTNFTISDQPETSVSIVGGASGGTDDIVTVVSQTDINNAENKITTNETGAKNDLTSELTTGANFYPLDATFLAATPTITPNASAGTAADSVTVTETVKYSMYGVIESDLASLLNSNIMSQVGSNQNILNNGLNSASYTVGSSPTSITLATNAVVGPNLNINSLKKEIVGQKAGAIESLIRSNTNVSGVSVNFSPFYVSEAPGASHITINIAKPTNSPANGSQ